MSRRHQGQPRTNVIVSRLKLKVLIREAIRITTTTNNSNNRICDYL